MGFFILVFRVVGIYADWCNHDVFWPCWELRSFIITLFLVFFFSDHVMMVFFLSVYNLRRLGITRQIFPIIASSCIWSVCLCYFRSGFQLLMEMILLFFSLTRFVLLCLMLQLFLRFGSDLQINILQRRGHVLCEDVQARKWCAFCHCLKSLSILYRKR